MRGRRGPAQFRPAGLVVGQVQRAGALEARAEAGLLLQRLEDLQAALDDLPGAERGPGRRDEPGCVPGGAEVSFLRSTRTTSVQPRLARWYAVLQPATPPPTTTTRVVRGTVALVMSQLPASGTRPRDECDRSGQPEPEHHPTSPDDDRK